MSETDCMNDLYNEKLVFIRKNINNHKIGLFDICIVADLIELLNNIEDYKLRWSIRDYINTLNYVVKRDMGLNK